MSQAILQHAIEFAWRHWTMLGVRGVAPPPDTAVDLEALLAFTAHIAADEPRLAREVADWCARIGPRFASIARLRGLWRAYPTPAVSGPVSLFELVSDRTVAARFHGSGKSSAPDLATPELVQLRARMLFGVSARADVLARLAAHAWSNIEPVPLRMLHPPGYARQSIAVVMDELALAGLLQKVNDGHRVAYRLVKFEALKALLLPLPQRTRNWVARLFVVATILDAWRSLGTRATYGVELAKVVDRLKRKAPSLETWPRLVGKPAQVVTAVDRWAIALLDDEAWRLEWLVGGTDISEAIAQRIGDGVMQTVSEGEYPVGVVDLHEYSYRQIDLSQGTAAFRVAFTAEHHAEEFSFDGHVEGKLRFAPAAQGRDSLIDSIRVARAEAYFDMGDDQDFEPA